MSNPKSFWWWHFPISKNDLLYRKSFTFTTCTCILTSKPIWGFNQRYKLQTYWWMIFNYFVAIILDLKILSDFCICGMFVTILIIEGTFVRTIPIRFIEFWIDRIFLPSIAFCFIKRMIYVKANDENTLKKWWLIDRCLCQIAYFWLSSKLTFMKITFLLKNSIFKGIRKVVNITRIFLLSIESDLPKAI